MRQQVPTRLDSLIVDLEALIFKKKPSSWIYLQRSDLNFLKTVFH
jgi:hypothetical protein